MSKLGEILLLSRTDAARRKWIKRLFASVDLDGCYDAWAASNPNAALSRTAADWDPSLMLVGVSSSRYALPRSAAGAY